MEILFWLNPIVKIRLVIALLAPTAYCCIHCQHFYHIISPLCFSSQKCMCECVLGEGGLTFAHTSSPPPHENAP